MDAGTPLMDGSALHPMASTTFLVWLAERSGGNTSFVTFAPNFASPSPTIAFNAAISASLSPIPSAPASAVRSRALSVSPCFRISPRGRDEPPNDIDWQDAHANAADAILIATSGPHPGRSNERMVHVRSFRTSINASTIAGEASGIRNEVRPASPMRSGPAPAPAIAAIEFAGIRSRSVAGGPSCLTTAFTPPAGPTAIVPGPSQDGGGPSQSATTRRPAATAAATSVWHPASPSADAWTTTAAAHLARAGAASTPSGRTEEGYPREPSSFASASASAAASGDAHTKALDAMKSPFRYGGAEMALAAADASSASTALR
mmetsp:Transcript_2201/g.8866  ORF Transcript_2201/g.8866 Transcript_2201/m.8866 type:complete len:319 (+) Transcript_2201:1250-2206(+)